MPRSWKIWSWREGPNGWWPNLDVQLYCVRQHLLALQKQTLLAADGQAAATLTVQTLEEIQTYVESNLFFERVEVSVQATETDEIALPRKRKAPKPLEVRTKDGHHQSTVAEFYRSTLF